jgi:hypothetical protein
MAGGMTMLCKKVILLTIGCATIGIAQVETIVLGTVELRLGMPKAEVRAKGRGMRKNLRW